MRWERAARWLDTIRRDSPTGAPLMLNSLTNVNAYEDKRWLELYDELGTYSHDAHIFKSRRPPEVYRKGWEWTQTIYGLERLSMIQPHHCALGVGAGRECVIFWLGDRLRRVVATDLYGNEAWTKEGGKEADANVLDDPQAFCPRQIRADSIEFKVMDGTDLRFEDETFDIVWSLSSIEHFGGHARAADAIREMARVTRPGGVAVVATEYLLLSDQSHDEFFNRADMEEYVLNACPRLAPIGPVDWTLPPVEYLIDSVVFPHVVDRTRRHVVLNDGHLQWTSFLAFFRKAR